MPKTYHMLRIRESDWEWLEACRLEEQARRKEDILIMEFVNELARLGWRVLERKNQK